MPSGYNEDIELVRAAVASGSKLNFKKRWIEFDCQNGVHHGKYAEYQNGKRIRTKGGYLGRFSEVAKEGQYGQGRVKDFPLSHNCHYPERFQKDLEESGFSGIEIKGWPSGWSDSGLSGSGRPSGTEKHGV